MAGAPGDSQYRAAEDDDYGRVDFNAAGDSTVATVWIERNPDGSHTVNAYDFMNGDEHSIHRRSDHPADAGESTRSQPINTETPTER